MSNPHSQSSATLREVYSQAGLENAVPEKKIQYLQDLLDVQVGIRFFSIGDNASTDAEAEQEAILMALEREYIETTAVPQAAYA